MTPDQINACFELGGAAAIALSCRQVLKAKSADGVAVADVLFFLCWCAYSVYYYTCLGQAYSQAIAMLVFCVRVTYVSLVVRYKFFNK